MRGTLIFNRLRLQFLLSVLGRVYIKVEFGIYTKPVLIGHTLLRVFYAKLMSERSLRYTAISRRAKNDNGCLLKVLISDFMSKIIISSIYGEFKNDALGTVSKVSIWCVSQDLSLALHLFKETILNYILF